MTNRNKLIKATEEFTGSGTVLFACATGFIMVEMNSEELAKEVAKVWTLANKMSVNISGNKVYAF